MSPMQCSRSSVHMTAVACTGSAAITRVGPHLRDWSNNICLPPIPFHLTTPSWKCPDCVGYLLDLELSKPASDAQGYGEHCNQRPGTNHKLCEKDCRQSIHPWLGTGAPTSEKYKQRNNDRRQQVWWCALGIIRVKMTGCMDGSGLPCRNHESAHTQLFEIPRTTINNGVDRSSHFNQPDWHGKAREDHQKT